MTLRTFASIAALAAVAANSGGCASHSLATPTQCSKTDRHGVYLVEATEQSGNCGPLPSTLVNFDDPSPTSCTVPSRVWTNGDCKVSATVHCPADASGGAFSSTVVTTQETQDGSLLDGIQTMQIDGPRGCLSTYNVRLTRK